MNMKVSSGFVVILFCICAAVWNAHVLVDLAYGFPNALHMILAIVWDVCAVVWFLRYLKSKRKPFR